MAAIVATQRNRIQSGTLGDKDATSCAGVPGTGSYDSAYIYVNTYLNTALDEDGYLWFANTSGYVRQTDMYTFESGNNWYSQCMLSTSADTVRFGGDYGSFTSRYKGKYFQQEIWKEASVSGTFTGNTSYDVTASPATTAAAESAGYWESGWKLEDCNPVTSGGVTTITLYVAYPVYYNSDSDDPVSLTMVPFTFDVTELIEYYPFAVYSSSAWQSCNRSGGALEKYSGSAWTDLKNIEDSTSDSTVFNYDGSSWNIAPKIGNE